MKALVLIKSCWKNKPRRDAIRDTWLPALDWADHLFLVGEHSPLYPFASRTSNQFGEKNMMIVPTSDEFKHIAFKVNVAMQRIAAAAAYDFVVMVDDDTYLRPERMLDFIMQNADADYIGFMRYETPDRPIYMQASCIVLSAAAVSLVAKATQLMLKAFPDDPAIGKALEGQCTWRNTSKIWVGPYWDPTPTPDNDLIATHKCLPVQMHQVHNLWERLWQLKWSQRDNALQRNQ